MSNELKLLKWAILIIFIIIGYSRKKRSKDKNYAFSLIKSTIKPSGIIDEGHKILIDSYYNIFELNDKNIYNIEGIYENIKHSKDLQHHIYINNSHILSDRDKTLEHFMGDIPIILTTELYNDILFKGRYQASAFKYAGFYFILSLKHLK